MELVTIPISGSFDANGHADISQRVQSSRYAAVTVSVKTVDQGANPTWLLQIGDALYLWGTGPLVARGPIPVRPEDQVRLVAFGGTRNDTFTGLIWGSVADTEAEIATVFQAQAQSTALQKSSDRINVTTTIVKPAASGTVITVADASQLQIADPVCLTQNPGPSQQTFCDFAIVAISRNSDGTWNVTFGAAIPAGGVNPGDVVTLIPTVKIDFANTVSVQAGPTPAAWQAPNLASVNIDSTLAGGANLTLVAAVAAKTVRVFGVTVAVDAAPGTGGFELQDSDGTVLHTFISTGAGTQAPQTYLGFGVPLTVAKGLRIHNLFSGSLTLFGSALASQS
jgi:hypothetical protein